MVADKPQHIGALLLFHALPGRRLCSAQEVQDRGDATVVAPGPPMRSGAQAGKRRRSDRARPADRAACAAPRPAGEGAGAAPPGERKDGTALFNPDREYRPDWDAKQVPGSTSGYPNSPNDYMKGKTFAYPPATRPPGEPPTMTPAPASPKRP